jgi:uncharacterized damage-inducible protein DinB
MTECARIAEQFRRMIEGGAWHGPSIAEALQRLTAEQAARRPVASAHTIYELVHHVGAWIEEVTRRLEGRAAREPDDGDFPSPDRTVNTAEWEAVQRRLTERASALLAVMERFDDSRLNEVLRDDREPPLAPTSYYATLHGLIEHTAYHTGQMLLLRRALGAA